jgi:hypothetical protein
MRMVRLVSLVPFALLAACGGGGGPQLVDASTPDAEVAIPDGELCPGQMWCEADSVCADLNADEQHCGDCTTACSGGQFCDNGDCACPAPFVPANPILGFSQESNQGPLRLEIGAYQDPNVSVLDVLVVGIDVAGTIVAGDPGYDLSGDSPGSPPFMAAGYNVNPQTMQADAAVYATAGHVTFSSICASGVSGTATDVTFSAVDSIQNPVIIEGGCSFHVDSVTFSYGTPCT